MGIFDIFTGSSAKKAAEQNARLYAQYGREAQGYIDAGGAAADAAYGKAAEAFTPLGQLGDRYNRAGALAMDAMGVNGADAAAAARAAFQASPGYQWSVDQATDAVARRAASLGMAASGNTMAEIGARAQQLANQDWNNWLGHLKGYSDSGLSATGATASGRAGVYGTQAGAYDNRALNRSNVAGNVASGTANSNTAAANAQMQASSNFWNGLMNAAANMMKPK